MGIAWREEVEETSWKAHTSHHLAILRNQKNKCKRAIFRTKKPQMASGVYTPIAKKYPQKQDLPYSTVAIHHSNLK